MELDALSLSPWVLLEVGFFFLSEDLVLSIRYPLAVELGVGLSGGGPWVLLELGFFFLSEDLAVALSIRYPLAVELVG